MCTTIYKWLQVFAGPLSWIRAKPNRFCRPTHKLLCHQWICSQYKCLGRTVLLEQAFQHVLFNGILYVSCFWFHASCSWRKREGSNLHATHHRDDLANRFLTIRNTLPFGVLNETRTHIAALGKPHSLQLNYENWPR